MTEMTAIHPFGRIGPKDVGIWSDAHIEPWRRIAEFLSIHGSVPGMQIGHAGRKASTYWDWHPELAKRPLPVEGGGWEPIYAPSAIALREFDQIPRSLNRDQIQGLIQAHAQAATRAKEAGFEWLELHAAHGYLHATFLSPFSNRRTDEWGGCFDCRCKFTLDCVRAIRNSWPDHLPFAVRLSCTEWIEDGWHLEDTIALSRLLKAEGVDLIDCSSGLGAAGGEYPSYPAAPGWQVPFSDAVRKGAGVLTAAVGMISDPMQADMIVHNEQADLVLLASAMLHDPYWPYRAAKALGTVADQGALMPDPYRYVVERGRPFQPEAGPGNGK